MYLLDLINQKKDYKGSTKFNILKILFKLKKELPDNNPLKENIPYYWYLHGPYSDVVDHDLKSLVFKNLIEKSDEGLYSLKRCGCKRNYPN